MDARKKEAILRGIAKAISELDDELIDGVEVDSIDYVDGELLAELEDGTQFAIKVEAI